jgi:hypothetical protein
MRLSCDVRAKRGDDTPLAGFIPMLSRQISRHEAAKRVPSRLALHCSLPEML